MRFWYISQFFLLSFWIPGMADLFLTNCKQWQREFFDFPTYNCSIPGDSTIRFPLVLNDWTYVNWRANSSSEEVTVLVFINGAPRLFSSRFQGCVFFDGYLNLGNLTEGQQGEYEMKEKETTKALIYLHVLPDQQSKRNWAVSAVPRLPTSFVLLCWVLLMLW